MRFILEAIGAEDQKPRDWSLREQALPITRPRLPQNLELEVSESNEDFSDNPAKTCVTPFCAKRTSEPANWPVRFGGKGAMT